MCTYRPIGLFHVPPSRPPPVDFGCDGSRIRRRLRYRLLVWLVWLVLLVMMLWASVRSRMWGVDLHMAGKLVTAAESLFTARMRTGMRFLPGVGSDVSSLSTEKEKQRVSLERKAIITK
jgi:hypothetical protein